MQSTEIFVPMKGYEGIYSVSNLGKVRSEDRIVQASDNRDMPFKECIRVPFRNNSGYLMLTLSNPSKKKTIHRLVAEHFVDNPHGYLEVNHIDGDKDNNASYNLEWCTRSRNNKHKYDLGYLNCRRKLTESEVKDIYENTYSYGGLMPNGISMSIKYGVSRSTISYILNNKKYLEITKHLSRK